MSVCKRVFSVGFGPGLNSMSPTSNWRFPKKTGAGPPDRQDKVDRICTVPLDCGTLTTRSLYPFGATHCLDGYISAKQRFILHS